MIILRKHQKRLVDQVLDNVQLSVEDAMDIHTRKVDKDSCIQTLIIAPWCKRSGKTGVIEYLGAILTHKGLRTLIYCANDEHMRERYHRIKEILAEAWMLKRYDDKDCQFLTSDSGGIVYFVSNE